MLGIHGYDAIAVHRRQHDYNLMMELRLGSMSKVQLRGDWICCGCGPSGGFAIARSLHVACMSMLWLWA